MAQVKELTELSLRDLWREVKDDFWEEINVETLRLVRRLLEGSLEEEQVAHLQATWYQRNPDRRGYRNGYRRRNLLTRWGLLEGLRVPRDREGSFQSQLLKRYRHRQDRVNVACLRRGTLPKRYQHPAGRVRQRRKPLMDAGVSAQTVSRICRSLDNPDASGLPPTSPS